MNRRTFLRTSAIAAAAATSTACFGSFPAIRWVYGFNKGISGSKFIQWLVFLVLIILPVYGIAGLIDIWVLNSLEFWFGGSPVSENEDPAEKIVHLRGGEVLRMRRDRVNGLLELEQTGGTRELALMFQFDERGARVFDGTGEEIARTRNASNGAVKAFSGNQEIAEMTGDEADEMVERFERGGAAEVAAWAQLRGSTTPAVADLRQPAKR